MKKYLTEANLIIALLVIGVSMLAIVIFFPSHKNEATLDLLKQQQNDIKKLTTQLQQSDLENKKRDSVLLGAFDRNTASREIQLSKSKQSANEKINRINSPYFNNDSIRRAFAE